MAEKIKDLEQYKAAKLLQCKLILNRSISSADSLFSTMSGNKMVIEIKALKALEEDFSLTLKVGNKILDLVKEIERKADSAKPRIYAIGLVLGDLRLIVQTIAKIVELENIETTVDVTSPIKDQS